MKHYYVVLFSFYASLVLTACGSGGSVDVATHLSVSDVSPATAGTPFEVTVSALDASNNVVTGYAGVIHFSSTDGQAVLPANSTLTNGTGSFSATLRTAGTQTITATDAATASITGTSASITVNAGPATHFAVAAPSATQSATAFDFTITALDAANNVAKSYVGTVHFSSSDTRAALPANSTLTDGMGTFPATLHTAGNQTLTATDTTTASITGTSAAIRVGAGPASHLSVSAPTTAASGSGFSFKVTALDAANNVATAYAGMVQFSSTDAQAVLPAASTLANGSGSFSATLQSMGNQTLTATDTLTASITGTSAAINVGPPPPPPPHFAVSTPAAAQSGTAFNFVVTALDAANNVLPNYAGTVQFSSTDSQALLPANSTLKSGTGSFSTTLKTAGTQTLTATDTATPSITGTSASIEVSAGVPTHFSVSAPTPAVRGQAFSFIVTARDAANNLAVSYAGTVHFSSTDTQATLPANSTLASGMGVFSATLRTTGSQTITATDAVTDSITGTSNAIDVFVNCGARGAACGFGEAPPCCPGLACEFTGDRMECE